MKRQHVDQESYNKDERLRLKTTVFALATLEWRNRCGPVELNPTPWPLLSNLQHTRDNIAANLEVYLAGLSLDELREYRVRLAESALVEVNYQIKKKR